MREPLRCTERIKVLSESEIDAVVEGALTVLETTGMEFAYTPALKVLGDAGAVVDYETRLARIPRDVVLGGLAAVPKSFVQRGRSPEFDVYHSSTTTCFAAQTGMNIIDRTNWQHRPCRKSDVAEWVTFVDDLDNVDWGWPPYGAYDVPQELAGEFIMGEALKYQRKPICSMGPIGALAPWHLQLEMADVAGREVMCGIETSSPLSLPENMCASLMAWAERRWPMAIGANPSPGATAPATLAGLGVQAAAESMAQIALAQIVGPGTPMHICESGLFLDMRSGALFSSVESVLHAIAWTQIAHRNCIPTTALSPFTTANAPDWQDGAERGMQIALLAMGGVNVFGFAGGHGIGTHISYDQLVRDNALISVLKRFLRGITVTPETLAVELIQKVGPAPGSYLGEAHTKKWIMNEITVPALFNTDGYEVWNDAGAKDIVQRSREKVTAMWETIELQPISEDQCREIDAILEKAVKGL